MILVLEPNTRPEGLDYRMLTTQLERLPNVTFRVHREVGSEVTLTEIYLIGNTAALTIEQMQVLPCVAKVVRVSEPYRVLGRHKQGDDRPASFEYNGVQFGQDSVNVFAGLCAVDSRESVEAMMKALRDHGQVCTRMGAYKPRTSPYAFQGYGATCLPYVFELAGKYGIRVIAMEVTHESHVDEIRTRACGDRQRDRRDAADRHAQHAELRAAEARRQAAGIAGAVQARLRHHARRVAERRRVPGHRRQSQGRLLPARHEDQHGRSASQLRRFRARAGGQAADADAGRASIRRTRSARERARPTACSTSSTSSRRASSPAPTSCSSISIRIRRKALVDGPQALLLSELRAVPRRRRDRARGYEKRTKLAREHGVAA